MRKNSSFAGKRTKSNDVFIVDDALRHGVDVSLKSSCAKDGTMVDNITDN